MNGNLKSAAVGAALLVALGCITSCRTANPLPPADLGAPGWHVMQGQALWKPAHGRSEVAADLLLATNETGDCFVELSKNPFPLVTAEVLGDRWQIQFGAGEHAWRGRGAPPARFSWFELPRALSGGGVAGDWRFERESSNAWRLENRRTGEQLEGGFFP